MSVNVGVAVRRYERELAANRERKRRYRGVCCICGGETRYNGHGKQVSETCASCHNKPREHCIRGHEFTPENRLKIGNEKGGFTCRICRNAYMRDYAYRRRREAGVPERGHYRRSLVVQAGAEDPVQPLSRAEASD